MNWYLVLFMMGIMIGLFIGVQPICSRIYLAILDAVRKEGSRKKNKGMF